jgi:serine/threonine protein phosphatase PrpC
LLLRLLEVLWRLELGSHPPADCATTCLLALLDRDRHLLVAALGDGLALVQRAGGELLPVGGRPEADFADETLALGAPHRLADWRWILLAPGEARAVVLATDGVADDLHPGRLGEFLAWLLAEIAPLDPRTRRRRLQRELRRWPVPRHTDDKTVAVLRIAPEDEP